MERSRRLRTRGTFQTSTICTRICSQCPQDVKERRYRIILTPPEMSLGNSGFAVLFKEPRCSRNILSMVIDEAHCTEQWGGESRKHYSALETLRSFVPRGVPVLATSATVPPDTLKYVRSSGPWEAAHRTLQRSILSSAEGNVRYGQSSILISNVSL